MQLVAPVAVAETNTKTEYAYVSPTISSRVLVVDEHDGSRTVMCHVLRGRGHLCETVLDASAAMCAIETFRPDIVLYEWCLRRGDGLGLAAKMRSASVRDGRVVRVIVVSVMAEPAGFCLHELVDAYFTKPVDMSILQRELRL
jgi:CheY-like chemotaxis protein